VAAGVYSGEINFAAASSANQGRLAFASALTFSAYPYTVNAVMCQTSANPSVLLGNSAGGIQFFRVDGLTTARFVPGSAYGTTFNASVPVVLTQTNTASNAATGWANGTNVGSTTSAVAQGLTTNGIGIWNNTNSYFALSELIVFPSALSTTDRENLERSQAARYGITYASTIASGFVSAWYDQSGNGLHDLQPLGANQPRIVNAGVLETVNGRPTLLFNNAPTLVANSSYTLRSASFVFNWSGSLPFPNGQFRGLMGFDGASSIMYGIPNSSTAMGSAIPSLVYFRLNGQNTSSGNPANLRTGALGSNGTGFTGNWNTGRGDSAANVWNGNISEAVTYSTFLPLTSAQALERSQGAAFGIIVT
jgi:hypothetical protein